MNKLFGSFEIIWLSFCVLGNSKSIEALMQESRLEVPSHKLNNNRLNSIIISNKYDSNVQTYKRDSFCCGGCFLVGS